MKGERKNKEGCGGREKIAEYDENALSEEVGRLLTCVMRRERGKLGALSLAAACINAYVIIVMVVPTTSPN